MPRRRASSPFVLPSVVGSRHRAMVNRLVREWAIESDDDAEDAPIIIEAHARRARALQFYVVWDEWRRLASEERAEVILAAFARVSPARAFDVALAVGLTRSEARQVGLISAPPRRRAPEVS